jgi:hypothetical protein
VNVIVGSNRMTGTRGEVTTEPNPFYDAETIMMPVAPKRAPGGENERLQKLDEASHVGN